MSNLPNPLINLADFALIASGVASTESKDEILNRRHRLADTALSMPSIYGERTSPEQLALFQGVFDNITPYPSTYHIYILMVFSGRSYAQIQSWFKKRRHVSPPKDIVTVTTEEGDAIRIYASIHRPWIVWSDRLFKMTAEKYLPHKHYPEVPLSVVNQLINLQQRCSGGYSTSSSRTSSQASNSQSPSQ